MFFKNGQFSVNTGDKPIEGKIKNISQLPIEAQLKRMA